MALDDGALGPPAILGSSAMWPFARRLEFTLHSALTIPALARYRVRIALTKGGSMADPAYPRFSADKLWRIMRRKNKSPAFIIAELQTLKGRGLASTEVGVRG